MRLVNVIPIARGISKETLSYFTATDVPLGSLVEIEVRKKKIKGLVIASEDATKARAKIRSADFGLKKIKIIEQQSFLSPAFIRAVIKTAKYHVTTTGAVLNAAILKSAFSAKGGSASGGKNKIDGKTFTLVPNRQDQSLPELGTGQYLSTLSDKVKKIVVEKESSSAYKMIARPFLDYRILAEFLAKEMGADFVLADKYPRVETYQRFPCQVKSESQSRIQLKDMRKEKFQILSDELKALIKGGEKLFIFAARRGLSPTTTCSDCGTVVICHQCGAPITLHKSKKAEKENFFLCHHCGAKRSALEGCANCGSWKLTSFGIGIEKIEEEIKENFPKAKIFRLDKESAPTPKKAKEITKKFYDSTDGILLGTELAFLYHRTPLPYGAIVSMDSLFAIPEFHIDERIFHILTTIQDLTKKKFLIQTRNAEHPVLTKVLTGKFAEFYREELATREKFGYPPFKVLIKISLEGKRATVIKEMGRAEKLLAEYQPFLFPALVGTRRGNFAAHMLIKTEPKQWPNEDLLQKLLSLPPSFAINVNPESLI